MMPRNEFRQPMYSLAGRYENPIPPRCLAPIDFLKIPALPTLCSGCLSKEKEERNKCRRDCKTEIFFSADWTKIVQKYADHKVTVACGWGVGGVQIPTTWEKA